MPSRTQRRGSTRSDTSTSSYSDSSEYSRSTAPTFYSTRRSTKGYEANVPVHHEDENERWDESYFDGPDHRSSVETYASTVPSDEDIIDDAPYYDEPEDYREDAFAPTAIPSTPPEFAEFFPSTRRLLIRHDDATVDGNMNLRVDTEVHTSGGRKVDLTLFHLRMHDLRNRDFSLRRYCRDSGREVCHTSRRYTKPASERRPGLQRSMSSALSSFRSKSDGKTVTTSSLKRNDSGYYSVDEDRELDSRRPSSKGTSSVSLPTNTIKLEFSNYAHVDVRGRGTKSSKRYEFEYWGTTYAWKRIARRDGNSKEISFHLVNQETSEPVAHIVPETLTTAEMDEEASKGGWVTPCSMWISNEKVLNGLTDVAE